MTNLDVAIRQKSNTIFIVKNASFSCEKGKTLAIVGESGSGKTTLANSIMQLLPQDQGFYTSGSIKFSNLNLLFQDEKALEKIRGAQISMIFQDPSASLHPLFTVGYQVQEMFLFHRKITEEEAREKTYEILKKVHFPYCEQSFELYPHQLSGGMKQRVVIAIALALEPQIVIADEPTTALDVTIQKEIIELLKNLQQELSVSIILISHDFRVVQSLAHEIAVMYASEIVEMGPKDDVLSSPKHPYTQSLLSCLPTKENRKRPLEAIKGVVHAPKNRPSGCSFHPRCPYAMPKCRTGEVPNFTIKNTHISKCWLNEPNTRS